MSCGPGATSVPRAAHHPEPSSEQWRQLSRWRQWPPRPMTALPPRGSSVGSWRLFQDFSAWCWVFVLQMSFLMDTVIKFPFWWAHTQKKCLGGIFHLIHPYQELLHKCNTWKTVWLPLIGFVLFFNHYCSYYSVFLVLFQFNCINHKFWMKCTELSLKCLMLIPLLGANRVPGRRRILRKSFSTLPTSLLHIKEGKTTIFL